MTRRHFQALADAIAALPESPTREEVAASIADVCHRFNVLFDRKKFLRACGVGR